MSFKPTDKVIYVEAGPNRRATRDLIYKQVSGDMGIDHKGRIWVPTARRDFTKLNLNEYFEAPGEKEPLFDFHIFDSEGIFLGSIPLPLPDRFFTLRIFGSRMF